MDEPDPEYEPLPDQTADTSHAFAQVLGQLCDLLGIDRSGVGLREALQALKDRPAPEEVFAPLVLAGVLHPDPSANRRLVEPAVAAFGRRRVKRALLAYLRDGTAPQRAGAARAWYWTLVPVTYRAGEDRPTAKSLARYNEFVDLEREWQETALRVFVADEHLDVRRCLLPGLNLRADQWSEEDRPLVARAVEIARNHPDGYLRHRVEHQV
ncbi:hypothetical protein Val02_21300 [Virgisporangium aliadipatigenens]|uniref:Uncharacterized protein n=1 Tax=Virgisporangium aliadipatigenens TaxID=741659 RepID=A0A8J3YHC0_9ACTN|nr:hypothetical protein [Virgisporangium aliadipatigenens]GIJ45244.1 hypothetical protein Val02_21300 [Virgisporangium aliadipatigenens]